MDIDVFRLLHTISRELRIGTVWVSLQENERGSPELQCVWYPDKDTNRRFSFAEFELIRAKQSGSLDQLVGNIAARELYEYRETVGKEVAKRLP